MGIRWDYMVVDIGSLSTAELQIMLTELGGDHWQVCASTADRLILMREGVEIPVAARHVEPLMVKVSRATNVRAPEPIGPRLTPREREIFELVGRGAPNRRISETLGIREQSVKNLVSTIMRKFGVENRVQLALKFLDEH